MIAAERFVRHAERFGTEGVFETAAEELPIRDLGRLAHRLQRVNPKFKLLNGQRRALAIALLQDGVDRKQVCWQTGISRTTLWRLEHELLETQPPAENGPANPDNHGPRVFQNEAGA